MTARLRLLCLFILLAAPLAAQQTTFSNSGGTISLSTTLSMTSSIGIPAATYSFNCPVIALPPGTYSSEWDCTGGSVSIQSTDGLTTVNGTITTGAIIETAAGGGRGGHITYYYNFNGSFTGSMTVNGQAQAIYGSTSQGYSGTKELGTGNLAAGITTVNVQYEPLYITDTYNNRIVRIDDMFGDNWTTLGTPGSGTKQFATPWGIALDSAGRIYVTDTANCRVVRMINISGAGWTSFGTCGAGTLQFNSPTGIALDKSGRIYVSDGGNSRIVRFNDMTGSAWATFGSLGAGTNQFNQPTGIAVDPSYKIYVADSGNSRLVRFDNFAGANWTPFGGPGSGVNQFSGMNAVTLDTTGRIYIADTYNNRIARIDDMLGANWTVLGSSGSVSFINPYGVAIDPYGIIYVADSRNYRIDMADDMTGSFFTTYSATGKPGTWNSPTAIVAAPPTSPIAVSVLTATKLSFANTVVGTASAAQNVTLSNIGSAPLDINSIVTGPDYTQANTCGNSLPAGQTCVLTVAFAPTAAGSRPGAVTINFATGAPKSISVSGIGTLITVSPLSLNFGSIPAGGFGSSLTVTVANPSAAPAAISGIVLTAAPIYRLKNPCPATLAAGASCTLSVKFLPQNAGVYNGYLTVPDGAGIDQKVTISGTGTSN
ncbi:MAG: choice-of-anchor D domain-containing protein [Bryobacteraceae bacterium]